jgi:hypothetical protein
MDHPPSHPTHDTDSYSDSLTIAYDEIGSWNFINAAGKDFNLTFDGTNVPQEPSATDYLGLSSTLRVGVPPYESSYVVCSYLPSCPPDFLRVVRLGNA